MVSTIIDWLVNAISTLGYPGVAIAMFLESFFAPIPSEIILPFSGFVCARDGMNIYVTIIVASLAAYLGSLPFYFIGKWGKEGVDRFLRRFGKYMFIPASDLDKGYKAFDRYGNGIVFFGRLIPIVRTVISFSAGVAKMNFGIFSLYTLLGSLLWSSVLAFAGFLLGENWKIVEGYVNKYENVIYVVLGVVVVTYIVRGIYKLVKKN
ncbi:MAG TPA: DedA family protein [Candidatus Dojkabacteria bacterium]|nr:DedA family protein [Candidatus Dojkabacteria bacterium]